MGGFSGDWPHKLGGLVSFLREFIVASGAWISLALMFAAGFARFCVSPARSAFIDAVETRLHPTRPLPAQASGKSKDGVVPVVAGTLGRIILLQVGISFGMMLVRSYGTEAPLLILIALKTLVDLRRGGKAPEAKPA